MTVVDHCKGYSHISLKSLRWRWWSTAKATLTSHYKCYDDGDESLQRVPWGQLKRLLWPVTKKATLMGDRSLKSLLWTVTKKATLVGDRSLKRPPWPELKRLLWLVNEKTTMAGDRSLKRLPRQITEKATPTWTEKTTLTCHWKGYDDM
jgi:hypothetical protein